MKRVIWTGIIGALFLATGAAHAELGRETRFQEPDLSGGYLVPPNLPPSEKECVADKDYTPEDRRANVPVCDMVDDVPPPRPNQRRRSAQKTPFERCAARAPALKSNQHIDNCARRYGNRAEKQKWFRFLAEDICTEMSDSETAGFPAHEYCVKKALRNPAQLCGEYLNIKCKGTQP
jgi:hypothetical protein